ncbi:hypothetical protein [Phaffia rhodozyma]|uniref:Uncharacterized protein n=1 Tax=Phaffia rhodozyma TaxID=264483 RepID=A0A0F7SMT5_PHARH|nr:hypothetical protein [Phaffia rhodozyma]
MLQIFSRVPFFPCQLTYPFDTSGQTYQNYFLDNDIPVRSVDSHVRSVTEGRLEAKSTINRQTSIHSFSSHGSKDKQVVFDKSARTQSTRTQTLADFLRSTGPEEEISTAPVKGPSASSKNNPISRRRSVLTLGRKLGSIFSSNEGNSGFGQLSTSSELPPVPSMDSIQPSVRGVQKIVTASGNTVNIISYPHKSRSQRPSTAPTVSLRRSSTLDFGNLCPAPTTPLPHLPPSNHRHMSTELSSDVPDSKPYVPSTRSSYETDEESHPSPSNIPILGPIVSTDLPQPKGIAKQTTFISNVSSVKRDRLPSIPSSVLAPSGRLTAAQLQRHADSAMWESSRARSRSGRAQEEFGAEGFRSGRTRRFTLIGTTSTIDDARDALLAQRALTISLLDQGAEDSEEDQHAIERQEISCKDVACQASFPFGPHPISTPPRWLHSADRAEEDGGQLGKSSSVSGHNFEKPDLEPQTTPLGNKSARESDLSPNSSCSTQTTDDSPSLSTPDRQSDATTVASFSFSLSRQEDMMTASASLVGSRGKTGSAFSGVGSPSSRPATTSSTASFPASWDANKENEWETPIEAWKESCSAEREKRKKVEVKLRQMRRAAEDQRERWDEMAGWALEVIESAEGNRMILRAENARLARELALLKMSRQPTDSIPAEQL